MNALVKLIIGFVLIVTGIYWYLAPETLGPNMDALVTLIRGTLGGFLAFLGLIFVLIGKEENALDKEEDKKD
ncbi:MAG: hypothetical protein KAT91_02415 [Candidatus Aenigmarchaeota archaeon]|nr:hypothetical protein [Candidatus Aenigmarchaeota archaeon]